MMGVACTDWFCSLHAWDISMSMQCILLSCYLVFLSFLLRLDIAFVDVLYQVIFESSMRGGGCSLEVVHWCVVHDVGADFEFKILISSPFKWEMIARGGFFLLR